MRLYKSKPTGLISAAKYSTLQSSNKMSPTTAYQYPLLKCKQKCKSKK